MFLRIFSTFLVLATLTNGSPCPKTCDVGSGRQSCDEIKTHTCSKLLVLGCNCNGCQCGTPPQPCPKTCDVGSGRQNCDEIVTSKSETCSSLRSKGCNCNGCTCDPKATTVATTTTTTVPKTTITDKPKPKPPAPARMEKVHDDEAYADPCDDAAAAIYRDDRCRNSKNTKIREETDSRGEKILREQAYELIEAPTESLDGEPESDYCCEKRSSYLKSGSFYEKRCLTLRCPYGCEFSESGTPLCVWKNDKAKTCTKDHIIKEQLDHCVGTISGSKSTERYWGWILILTGVIGLLGSIGFFIFLGVTASGDCSGRTAFWAILNGGVLCLALCFIIPGVVLLNMSYSPEGL